MLFANCKYGCGATDYCYDHFIHVFRCYLFHSDLILCLKKHFRLTFSLECSSVYRELLRMRMIGFSLSGDNGQTTGINVKKLGVITTFRFQLSSVKVVK